MASERHCAPYRRRNDRSGRRRDPGLDRDRGTHLLLPDVGHRPRAVRKGPADCRDRDRRPARIGARPRRRLPPVASRPGGRPDHCTSTDADSETDSQTHRDAAGHRLAARNGDSAGVRDTPRECHADSVVRPPTDDHRPGAETSRRDRNGQWPRDIPGGPPGRRRPARDDPGRRTPRSCCDCPRTRPCPALARESA